LTRFESVGKRRGRIALSSMTSSDSMNPQIRRQALLCPILTAFSMDAGVINNA